MAYTVFIDENGHYRDASERYQHGTFATYDEAVAACQRIVDEFLAAQYRPVMIPDDLFRLYMLFGEDPFIRADAPDASRPIFSAWEYARLRCTLLCVQAPEK